MSEMNEEFRRKMLKDVMLTIAACIGNRETFKDMKGMNAGKEVVLCGAGPSLSSYVPIEGALHVALNRALLYDKVKYDWFIADDWVGLSFFQEELLKYDCTKFFGRYSDDLTPRAIPQSFGNRCGAKWFYEDMYVPSNADEGRFVIDIDKMPVGGMPNIALIALQIVLFTNPRKIYLVGCDASMGHFKKFDVDKSEARVSAETTASQKAIDKWKVLKKFAQTYYPDVEIVSVNPVGLKGIFEDIIQ